MRTEYWKNKSCESEVLFQRIEKILDLGDCPHTLREIASVLRQHKEEIRLYDQRRVDRGMLSDLQLKKRQEQLHFAALIFDALDDAEAQAREMAPDLFEEA